jgi:hypothetical protein
MSFAWRGGVCSDQLQARSKSWILAAATGFDLGEGALLALGEWHDPTS